MSSLWWHRIDAGHYASTPFSIHRRRGQWHVLRKHVQRDAVVYNEHLGFRPTLAEAKRLAERTSVTAARIAAPSRPAGRPGADASAVDLEGA